MASVVMLRRKLQIDMFELALRRLVLNAQIPQSDPAVHHRQSMFSRDFLLPPVIFQRAGIALSRELRIDFLFQLIVENNTPDLANFPQGVTFQRAADFKAKTLSDGAGNPVPISIDPFYFSVPVMP